jgi:hypothetical protein
MEILWFVGLLALFILAWKPLYRRFRGWAIISAYLLFALAMVALIVTPHDHYTWKAFFICMAVATLILLMYRQKPIEERRPTGPTVVWAVIHGLWDQLAEKGVPADEIERLKKLTQEERARLMAPLLASVERAKRGVLQKLQKNAKWKPNWSVGGLDDYYTSASPHRMFDDE